MGTESVLPSTVPDEFADNHAVELETCMRWFFSDAGQVAKNESPAGYANVCAHAMLQKRTPLSKRTNRSRRSETKKQNRRPEILRAPGN